MIEVKEAVAAASDAALEFFSGKELLDLRLEEVEMSDDHSHWLITLGFLVPDPIPARGIAAMLPENQQRYERKYKVFVVDAQSGTVESMKIRQV